MNSSPITYERIICVQCPQCQLIAELTEEELEDMGGFPLSCPECDAELELLND